MKKILTLFVFITTLGKSQNLYFPPVAGTNWDTLSPQTLGWCPDKVDSLLNYVGQHNTKAFIILKGGKIVLEKYYGTFTVDSAWYWASAGKTLTAFLVGLAQEQGYLNIYDSLPKYLGHGFSTCSAQQEDSIRIIHQLTMTTGFDDMYGGVTTENHCTDDSCLVCLAEPGTRWAYHNAPYTMLDWILDSATHTTVNNFKNTNLLTTCGITGLFYPSGYDNVYVSKARAFARFGLLLLNKGKWNTTTIMGDTAYFQAMTNTSQNINLSYGYLTWLNGKSSFHIPNVQFQFNGMLEPDAPADMFAALGKNDQFLNVVPSQNLVVVRMGNPMYSGQEVGMQVNDSVWVRINDLVCNNASIKTNAILNNLKIYPNPTNDKINVSTSNMLGNISIYNTLGEIVLQVNSTNNQEQIDISKLNTGVYFMRILNSVQKISKQ